MSIGDSSITFYHLASRQAHLNDSGSNGGRLFTLAYSEDYSFTNTEPNYTIIGSGEGGVYYVTQPTDLQGYTNDSSVWSEWQDVSSQVDWVISHISMIHVSESSPAADLDVNSLAFLRIQHRRGQLYRTRQFLQDSVLFRIVRSERGAASDGHQ